MIKDLRRENAALLQVQASLGKEETEKSVAFCAGRKFVQEGLGRWAAGWEAPGRQDERNP